MKPHTCSLLFHSLALAGLLTVSAAAQTYYGDSVAFGDGWLRTYVEYDTGSPARLGIQLNQAAFTAFASAPETATRLALPSQVPAPYNHVLLDWNPEGHPGPGYDAPHFDFHFYYTSPEEVDAIAFNPVPPPVDPAYVAPNYIPDLVVVPQMGLHYLDLLAPEFNGGAFTHTFIYGYNDGHQTFVEPMITYATLQAGESFDLLVRQPTNFERAGYYPTEYGFSLTDGVYNVYLGGLEAVQASPVPEPSTYGAFAALALFGAVAWRRFRLSRSRQNS